ncbi:MAG: hypothetical protein OIN85_02015, partial [Candidatus Methanoperedens sp.]|nr:hypothetical protein [Candidatus Methanoperedens sp.]
RGVSLLALTRGLYAIDPRLGLWGCDIFPPLTICNINTWDFYCKLQTIRPANRSSQIDFDLHALAGIR